MRTRWKILIGLTVFVVLATGLALISLRYQPENELETYKKLLRAKGEKLTLNEVLSPPVPPESNCVNVVQAAFGMLSSGSYKIPEMMKMVAPGKALIGWQQPDARGFDFTNTWAEFTAGMETNRPKLALLHEILNYPRLVFPADYQTNSLSTLPLVSMKRAAQDLAAASLIDLHNGNPAEAVTNILTELALVQKNETDGLLISYLVRLAMNSIAVGPTWELLQATNVTEAQLASMQTGWTRCNFFRDAEYTFVAERAWSVRMIQKSRVSHEDFEKNFGGVATGGSSGSGTLWSWPPDWEALTARPRSAFAETMWRSSWSYSSELHTLHSEQLILETLRTIQTNQSQFYKADYDALQLQLTALGKDHAWQTLLRVLKAPDYLSILADYDTGAVVQKAIRLETARRMVITAIALKRFQLRHGHLPETLAALVPEYLSAVPIDPQDGRPLRYHPNADGTYLLYSVGEDGKDDGGDPTIVGGGSSGFAWQNPKARDWVWPQPATAAEIKHFREHPPK